MDLTFSYKQVIPERVLDRWEFREVRNAAAILHATNRRRFDELVEILDSFEILTSDLVTPGGQESDLAARLNSKFRDKGWREARTDTVIQLKLQRFPYQGEPREEPFETEVVNPGYKVDNFVDRIASDVEWNAKDGNLDRDLGAYRFIYEAGLIDLGILVTRTQQDLRELGRQLGLQAGMPLDKAKKILGTTTTTNLDKLQPRLTRGDSGGCPVLVAAMCARTWEGAATQTVPPTVVVPDVSIEDEGAIEAERLLAEG